LSYTNCIAELAGNKAGHIQQLQTNALKMKKWVTFTIVEAENLPIGDSNGFSDPYVTVEYYPGNQRLLKTSVKQKTLNPKWVC
jgi:Ca2+-dependent lipid-binding protein